MDDPLFIQASQETEAFYLALKTAYEQSEDDQKLPLTELWGTQNMKVLLDIIHADTDLAAKIQAVQETFLFSVSTSDQAVKEWVMDWYNEYLLSRGVSFKSLDPRIQESPYSNQRNGVLREGRLLTPDFLRTVVLCLEIDKYCSLSDRSNVLEIGAGYGGLARSIKLFHPGISYVIIDIPESLYFSSAFLRLNFPRSRFCYVTDSSRLPSSISGFDFVFVPTLFAEALLGTEFTLFCNTASLGEMKNSVIRYWMDFVQNRIRVKYFFGVNRFLNTIYPQGHPEHQSFRLNENCCSVSFDEAWRILRWELEPPFMRCPYLETEVSRNLEIIAERLPREAIDPQENRVLSRKLAEKVAKQDWYTYADADNTMKLRDNILAPDLTMRGTLFALWESIRLYANPTNLAMMLKYLSTLTRGKPFEEMFYYQDLLNSLSNSPPRPPPTPSPRSVFSVRDFLRELTPAPIRRFIRHLYYGS